MNHTCAVPVVQFIQSSQKVEQNRLKFFKTMFQMTNAIAFYCQSLVAS